MIVLLPLCVYAKTSDLEALGVISLIYSRVQDGSM